MESNASIRLGFAVLALALGIWAYAESPSPTPFDVSKIDFSKISEDDIAKTIAHKNELKGEVLDANNKTDQAARQQAQTLVEAANSTVEAQKALAAYQLATKSILNQANAAIAAHDQLVAKLHLAKWILSAIATLVVWLIALKANPPVSFYAGGAATVLVNLFIWTYI